MALAAVFTQAFSQGLANYVPALTDPATRAALRLTLLAAANSVPLNPVFGVAADWAIAEFECPGKSVLITLINLPFLVSPVVVG